LLPNNALGVIKGVDVKAIANVLTGLVALSHIGFLVLEMFFWDHPVGRRIFGMTPEVSASSAVLAANQGLYNGFLAAGLLWALWADRRDLKVFFLSCVGVAGVFGGMTAKTSILLTQALPAAIALGVVVLASRRDGQ
jgi:putative membrane protein